MAFLDQNPPSFNNQLEYDKWVADQLKAADADQDRQDKDLEDFKEEAEDTYEKKCPVVSAIADKWKDNNSEETQIVLTYFQHGAAPDGTGYPSVRTVRFKNPPDPDKQWININGERHEAFRVEVIADDVEWSLYHASGDLGALVGTEVTLDNCDDPSDHEHDQYLPLKGGNMTGAANFNPTPYNGITVFGKDGAAYNNGTKLVFRAENGGSYTDPQVIVGLEPVADNHAATKKYVDDIAVELEEEIDAIAPSVERGVWAFNLGGLASSRGQLSMYDNDYSNVGNPIGIFKQAKSIWLNEEDNAGTPHGFDNVEAGNLLELFVEGEADYGLFEVVDVHDETNGVASWWVIEVNFVRALSDTSLASNGDNIRLKIFSAPSGGTADEFVLKAGDSMAGRLRMDTQDAEFKKDYRKPTDGNRAFIQLKNVASTSTKLASIWQPQATNEVALGSSVHIESIIYCNAWYGYNLSDAADGSGRRERITQEPNMQFLSFNGDDRGRLKWGGNDRINWTEAGGSLFSDNNQAKLTWNTEGIVLFQDSYGSTGTEGQVLKRTADANYMKWSAAGAGNIQVLPDTPDDPQVGDCWFSTDKNTFIIKVA